MSWVAIDGALVPKERAVVSVYDRGFLYGDSVFESMRTYGGQLFRLREHVERLARSAEIVRMPLPRPVEVLAAEIDALVEACYQEAQQDLSVRLLISRGEGPLGLLARAAATPRRVLFLERFSGPPKEQLENGVAVALVSTFRPSDAARGAKVGNYLESIIALETARDLGADEALMVDGEGFVTEGATSNLFIIKNLDCVTPAASSSLLPGITRRTVIELCEQLGLPLHERPIRPADLLAADEVFITSTLRGIIPVRAVDGRAIGTGSRPVIDLLSRAFSRLVALEPTGQ